MTTDPILENYYRHQACKLILQRVDYGLYAPGANGSLREDLSHCTDITTQFNTHNLNGFDNFLYEMRYLTQSYINNNFDLDKTVAANLGIRLNQNTVEEFYEECEGRDITKVDEYLEEMRAGKKPEKVLSQVQSFSEVSSQHKPLEQPINASEDLVKDLINDLEFLNDLYYESVRNFAPETGMTEQDQDEQLYGAYHAFQYYEDAIDTLIVLAHGRKYETINANFFEPSAFLKMDHQSSELH